MVAAGVGNRLSEDAYRNNVAVFVFASGSLSLSLAELDKIAAVEKELGAQGVVFAAICDGRPPWEKIADYVKGKTLTLPVMQDSVEKRTNEDGKVVNVNVTADAFGVEHYPATVIIDRAGRIRAAGVKADRIKAVVEKLLAERVGAASPGGEGAGG
jgi:hypothetical protein